MYGEWVTLFNEPGYEVQVWISCTPNTTSEEKRNRAIRALLARIGDTSTPDEEAKKMMILKCRCPKCGAVTVRDMMDVFERCLSCGWYQKIPKNIKPSQTCGGKEG